MNLVLWSFCNRLQHELVFSDIYQFLDLEIFLYTFDRYVYFHWGVILMSRVGLIRKVERKKKREKKKGKKVYKEKIR